MAELLLTDRLLDKMLPVVACGTMTVPTRLHWSGVGCADGGVSGDSVGTGKQA